MHQPIHKTEETITAPVPAKEFLAYLKTLTPPPPNSTVIRISSIAMERLKVWEDLGVVDTIHEEEEEHEDSSPLHCRVKAWTLATRCETDVLIQVQGKHFHLHRDPLVERSRYLKRHLERSPEITLSPPFKITAEAFGLVVDFCYGADIVITPFNVAALRVAADLLEMTDADDASLRQRTEAYFRLAVGVSREYALIIFRSCLPLLPEAETTSAFVSRCLDAFGFMVDDDDSVVSCFDGVKTVPLQDFQAVVESLRCRLTGSHDGLYRIIDLYLKENGGRMTEEQKWRICNSIDCTMLSLRHLTHAVQNPSLPLRFLVQAMFVGQLTTRRSILGAGRPATADRRHPDPTTLGAILQSDASLRHATQLKASMDATSSRIRFLEKELDGLKMLLHELESARLSSAGGGAENRVERGQKGSVSSGSFRMFMRREQRIIGGRASPISEMPDDAGTTPRLEKRLGRKLVDRLKDAFRSSNSESKKKSQSIARSKVVELDGVRDGEEYGNLRNVIVIKKDVPFHRRARSLG
ncbi:BTB/POZ domain-containing protein At3g49900 [Diospyros lotus]|uniref:BTB/POZ domain-containing protein At3g49900 n=1 Tax=Diospyros lotus TaxID=55363 RepID=UPI002255409F|nr:BTB/POZ domain-containing protein At3g49900 [Diospyros lotus]